MLAHVTITGQLAMLMLIEHLYLLNVEVISANTDGISVRCRRSMITPVETMVKQWCDDTGFTMDYEYYKSIHYLNVNNYFYHDTDGHMHGIGYFADDGIRKSQEESIVRDALFAYIKDGTPVEDTISKCQDIDSFVTLTQVTGGCFQEDDNGGRIDMGKVVRFYKSISSDKPLLRSKPNAQGTHGKVPNSDNCVVVNDYPNELPTDIDYHHYDRKAYEVMVRLELLGEDDHYYRCNYTYELLVGNADNLQYLEKSVDDGAIDKVSFSSFLVELGITKAWLRKNKLAKYISLIPVKKRKPKAKASK